MRCVFYISYNRSTASLHRMYISNLVTALNTLLVHNTTRSAHTFFLTYSPTAGKRVERSG